MMYVFNVDRCFLNNIYIITRAMAACMVDRDLKDHVVFLTAEHDELPQSTTGITVVLYRTCFGCIMCINACACGVLVENIHINLYG